ncbi:TIGR03087 family PEP-CTERM/XrtA system glycosyltransferase [Thalassotalea sp. M1531]|uniref:TIGR03087 family PEP-CTERM/XrtA system glycosyltransferase n=2 Tax=Thalassotalea algicola TaxID=2716224 RepID=A0A7Y0LF35_9GAMM|nr:TIGR03087 family PEP-CTERM/XrtA system glycosyltransferase [Thalassotalea algicola]
MSKEPLLFLCHRIPFPPNKGDKIRSFNILKMLNEHFDVYLGCFVDDPYDERYIGELKKYCKELFYLNQNKTLAKLKGLSAFLSGKAITLPYYFDRKMANWVSETAERKAIAKVFIYSSSMAQYCQGDAFNQCHRVIDFVDVDSDKWRQYAEKKSGISKFVFNREYKKLAEYEDLVCQQFDISLFVSPDEADLFKNRQPKEHQDKVSGLLNGVDVKFFDPDVEYHQEPLVPNSPFISFTGAMDYWANVDAVLWFVEHVWPDIKRKVPEVKFVVAGGNPSKEILALKKDSAIVVTGRVNDMRPFIEQATCVVAPLRIARGIQNKVLEAMALNKPVVCTSMAMEGINAPENHSVRVEDNAAVYANACVELLNSDIPANNRQWILDNFTWESTLAPLQELLEFNENREAN